MLEELKEKYFEEVRALLPLHRIFLFALGFITALVCPDATYKSIIESLIHLKIKDFSFEAGNLLENAQIWHIALGLLVIFTAWLTNKTITGVFFSYILRKTKASEKITSETQRIKILISNSREAALEQLADFEKKSEIAKQKITQAANFGECFLGIFICSLGAFWFGNAIDLIVSFTSFSAALVSIYMAIFMFYSKYVRFDILRSSISGLSPEIRMPS